MVAGRAALLVLLVSPQPTVLARDLRAAFTDFTVDFDTRMSGSEYRRVFTLTAARCASVCYPLALCKAFSYNRISGSCSLISQLSRGHHRRTWVTGVRIAPRAAPAAQQQHLVLTTNSAVVDGSRDGPAGGGRVGQMRLEYGVERLGSGYRVLRREHAEQCARSCDQQSACYSFRYVPRSRECVLFDTLAESQPRLGVVSGVKQTAGDGQRLQERDGFVLHQDTVLYGRDYRQQSHSDLSGCLKSCERDPECRAFSFEPSRESCALKQVVPIRKYRKGAVSGFRQRQR